MDLEPQFESLSDPGTSIKPMFETVGGSKDVSHTKNDCFECNICLETANEPVVTLCGHLYCWPCIYKWLNHQTQKQNCPVCKSNLSANSLVPLYSNGGSLPESEVKKPNLGIEVPRRPTASNPLITTSQQQFDPNILQPYGTNTVLNPTIVMLGEMVFDRVFGVSDTRLSPYRSNSSSYTSPRLRRQEMQIDKSLSRVSIFFFCCIISCLLLF